MSGQRVKRNFSAQTKRYFALLIIIILYISVSIEPTARITSSRNAKTKKPSLLPIRVVQVHSKMSKLNI